MRKQIAFPCWLLALLTFGLAALSASALTVTTLADSGSGSLRQLITDAPSGATITFSPSLAGQTIVLTGNQLLLAKSVVIDGSALTTGITISGSNFTRIFEVVAPSTVSLIALTLRNGSASYGGAIFNNGGNLTVNACTLRGNAAQFGGALGTSTTLTGVKTTIVNSTITGNTASSQGGGIYNFEGLTEVLHSTVAGNTAPVSGGGGIVSFGHTSTRTSVSHSIIAGNSGTDVVLTTPALFNSFVSIGSNLAGFGNALAAFTASGDQTQVIPLLAPLGNYGGSTATMPPLPGSTAIEGGILLPATPALDQRNAPRPSIQLPDIGAVEAVAIGNLGLISNDGDKIPDVLETVGGPYPQLSATSDDSSRDTDGDGSSDEDEINNSTNPLDPNSRFRVSSFQITEVNPIGHQFSLDFTSFPGLAYAIEFSANLDFSNPRVIHLGTATDFLSDHSGLRFSPTERFVRVRRE